MKPRVWIAGFSAAAVVFVTLSDIGRTSPGALAAVHENGGPSCAQCHGGWFQTMTKACLECHQEIGTQIDTQAGLHGGLGRDKAERCALCHSDHHGADFAMVNRQSFLQAGIDGRDAFDHELVGFAMAGKHLEVACGKCHENADIKVLPEGEPRFQGITQDCAACHEDAHEGRMTLHCAECHGQESFEQLHSADHEEHLPLVGSHAEVACRVCHTSIESLGAGPPPAVRTCANCHESPHRTPFPAESCDACHKAEHAGFRDERLVLTPAQHAGSGFPLAAPHDRVTCEQCHPAALETFSERYPGRQPDQCRSCHEDVHQGQFAEKSCLDCHDRHRFEPHAFTVAKHAQAALPLTGSHLDADCAACHKGSPRVFRGTPSTCNSCHADAHAGFFEGECASCHTTKTFSEIPHEFDHGRWTGFQVVGAHAQEDCESCHPRSKKPDEFGRTFGRVSGYEDCASCHKDPHKGKFEVDGKTSCARCHVETSFRALRGFDHEQWTGFALEGVHATAECAACHKPTKNRAWGNAAGRNCADCHNDPHAGQFRPKSCRSCHRSLKSFADLTFRHDLDSRFRLGKAHKEVACAACHTKFRGVLRYRPLGRKCSDCHTSQKDPLRRRKR